MSIQSINNNSNLMEVTSENSSNKDSLVQFSEVLANTLSNTPIVDNRHAEFFSGRFGIDLTNGIPSRVSYYDENGHTLSTSSFNAKNILQNAEKYSISLTDLEGLGTQLDSAGVGYRPYELYPGTGSDHGVDFQDLIEGGLGTAYDWREDSNAALKDTYLVGTAVEGQASRLVREAQEFAERIGVVKNSDVTTERGVDPSYFTELNDKQYIVNQGGSASWYETREEAENYQMNNGGVVIDTTEQTPASQASLNSRVSTSQEQLKKGVSRHLKTS